MEIITANSLGDGRVVFQTHTGWSQNIEQAEVLDSADATALALARAKIAAAANRVVEPYAIEVKRGPGGLVPVRLRERIRAEGPTTGNSKPAETLRPEAA
jgi:sulfite reductase (NADPH) hemoprotein beta-component